tara:strand:+ start:259 stop:543 length:285 start_codon:yes stop_codon:yes gene_type:complete
MERDNVIPSNTLTRQDFLNGKWFWCEAYGMFLQYVDDAWRPGHVVDRYLNVAMVVTDIKEHYAAVYWNSPGEQPTTSDIPFNECEVVKFSEVYK